MSLASVRCLLSHPFSLHVTRSYSLYHCQFKSKIEFAAGGWTWCTLHIQSMHNRTMMNQMTEWEMWMRLLGNTKRWRMGKMDRNAKMFHETANDELFFFSINNNFTVLIRNSLPIWTFNWIKSKWRFKLNQTQDIQYTSFSRVFILSSNIHFLSSNRKLIWIWFSRYYYSFGRNS